MTIAQGIFAGLLFIIACVMYLIAHHIGRIRDDQAEVKDQLMLIRVGQMYPGTIVFQGQRMFITNHLGPGKKTTIHCWNGHVWPQIRDDTETSGSRVSDLPPYHAEVWPQPGFNETQEAKDDAA